MPTPAAFARGLTLCAFILALGCEAGVQKAAVSDLPADGASAVDPFSVYNDGANIPFFPVPLETSARKFKALLWGDNLSASEIDTLADPDGLKVTVHRWVTSQEANRALLDFFSTAFQQQSITNLDNLFPMGNADNSLTAAVTQSFPRTALDVARKGLPFTSLYTTHSFMVTTKLLMAMLYSDLIDVDDDGRRTDIASENGNFSWTYVTTGTPIPLESSVDPKNASFRTYYAPNMQMGDANCRFEGPITITRENTRRSVSSDLYNFLNGRGFSFTSGVQCDYNANNGKVTNADAADWRPITFEAVPDYASITPFYDLPRLRAATTVKTRTRRTGFFTTPAFFGQWQSNVGNQARGIANQTLIVGLGRVFDGNDHTVPASLAALDAVHADFGSACYGCHVTMDPMRQFFRQAYSHSFHLQTDQQQIGNPGVWAMDGATSIGVGGIDALAMNIATHPDVGMVWTRRLCSWINNVPCLPEDPEVIRLATSFRASNYNFMTLLEDMLTSPLSTNAAPTLTAVRMGVVPTMARSQDFCALLARRLGTPSVCMGGGNLGRVAQPLAMLPTSSYNRGLVQTVSVTSPTMMTRTATENVCGLVATEVVDGALKLLPSADPEGSVGKMVSQLMGVSDAKAAPYLAVLKAHYADCVAQKMSPADALRSTFTVACMSPRVAMIGL